MTEKIKAARPDQIQAAGTGEKDIIKDAENVLAAERFEAQERAELVADGVVMPVAPTDVDRRPPDEEPESSDEVDFTDGETVNEEHGRGLV